MKNATIAAVIVVAVALLVYYSAASFSRPETETPQTGTGTPDSRDELPLMDDRYQPADAPDPVEDAPEAPEDPLKNSPERERAEKLLQTDDPEKLCQARGILTKVLLQMEDGPERQALRNRLDALNRRLFFSPLHTPDSLAHTVKKNESFWSIGRRYGVSHSLLKLVNRRNSDILRPGETLKIPQGDFSVLVEREHFRLTVLFNGHYIKQYNVGIGKEDLTPKGRFVVERMSKNPAWTDLEGRVHEFGDPENPLGTRWIGFKSAHGRSGLGIHGTSEKETIGSKCSRGCIRLLNRDVEELYTMLNPDDEVTIK